MDVDIITHTNGRGPNTEEKTQVVIHNVIIGYSNHTLYPEDPFMGELRAYFNPSGFTKGSWNVSAYGHIHGDVLWLREFRAGMRQLGLSQRAVSDIRYNHLDLQREDYVSLEVGPKFYASWQRVNKKLSAA